MSWIILMEIEAITCHQTKKSFQNQNEIYDENFENYSFLPLNMRLFGRGGGGGWELPYTII